VLAERGLRTLHRACRRTVQAKGDARLAHRSVHRVVDVDGHAVVDDLLVFQRLVCVPHGRDGDLVGPEPLEQVLPTDAAHAVAHQVVLGQVLRNVERAFRGLDAEDPPDHAAVLAPPAGEVHRMHPQAVRALVDVGLRVTRDLEPGIGLDRRVLPELGREREHTLVERRLHPLAATGDLADIERCEDALHREVRRGDARQRSVQVDRAVAEAGLLVLHARARLHQEVDCRPVGGVGRTRVTRERAEHERGTVGGDAREVEPTRREVPGGEALDEHVGGVDQREQSLPVGLVVEVEHDAALAAVGDDGTDVPPLRIAARWLHLHDVGAVIAERHRRERSREPRRQVDDP
jgi:hypothetical protein